MRRLLLPSLITALLLAGPAHASDPGTLQQKDTLRDAVAAPLEDLNLKRTAIPPVLLRAVDNPYDLEDLTRCEGIAGEIGRLDAALGPDLDEAPPPDTRSRGKKVADAAYGAGVGEVRNTTQHVLPFRGWVRKLTGASRHDKAVQAAIRAGGVRRGYLTNQLRAARRAQLVRPRPAAQARRPPGRARPAGAPGGLLGRRGELVARMVAVLARTSPYG